MSKKPETLGEIADLIQGQLHGPPDMTIKGIDALESARDGYISFAVNASYVEKVKKSEASAFIFPLNWPGPFTKPVILVKDPNLSYAIIANAFSQKEWHALGISSAAFIGKDVCIHPDVSIYPHVYIGERVAIGKRVTLYPGVYVGDDVSIGDESTLYPNVVVYHSCKIGKDVIIHSGTVIGSDGFGYAQKGGMHLKIPQNGIVVIEDEVEIGSNVSIDRATFGETRIGIGTKIDNLVQIAHNVNIGPYSILVSQVGISGSCLLGKGVILGGQVGLAGHIKLGDGVMVGAKSGIAKDVPPGEVVSGIPAMPHKKWLRVVNVQQHLPYILKEVRELRKRLEKLEGGQKDGS